MTAALIDARPKAEAGITEPAATIELTSTNASTIYSSPFALGFVKPLWSAKSVTVYASAILITSE